MSSAAPSRLSRFRKSALRLLAFALLLYLAVVLVVMFFENRLVFVPTRATDRWIPAPASFYRDVNLVDAEGTKLHAWWCPCAGSDHAVLFLHGNGGNVSYYRGFVQELHDILKVNVLIVDYPGYGKSDGTPSETGCYAAADAAYDWLVEQQKIEPQRVTLFGLSLGGGVAVNLASRKKHEALVLVKTFTSLPDVGQHAFPWLPVRWLARNRFDSLAVIGSCASPVFVASSLDDQLVPYAQGKKLFEAAKEPKEFFTLRGSHNDGLPHEFYDALKSFLRRQN